MSAILAIAVKEIRDGLRNRWVIAATLLLASLALALALLGSAPTGTVKASPLAVTVVSLSSLTIFLIPLIALLLSYDAVVGEVERGTLLLLLAYPVTRWQVMLGKFLGHVLILAFATVLGYGAAGLAIAMFDSSEGEHWGAFGAMIGSSVLLGSVFVSIGYLLSVAVRERGTAAGLAVAVWLMFVLLYDLALLGGLVADQGKHLSAEVFRYLLLLNPADMYRLFNLSAFADTRLFSGMAGIADEMRFSPAVLLSVLLAWAVVPLGVAGALFARKEL